MSEVKHTPGPWSSSVNGFGFVKVEAHGFDTYDGSVIVSTMCSGHHIGYDVEKANARLIAAAPDMLDALKAMVKKIDPVCMVEDDHPQADLADEYRDALWAIAKAEGRDQ